MNEYAIPGYLGMACLYPFALLMMHTVFTVDLTSGTITGIESIYIHDHSARVEKNKIVEYRINAKITFKVERK